jgi:hypothetical protein
VIKQKYMPAYYFHSNITISADFIIFFYYDISICSAEKGKGNSRMEHIFDER